MKLPDAEPIRRKDLKPCVLCGKGLLHDGNIGVYRVTFEQHIVDHSAVMRAHGLETFFGGGTQGAVLADVMGTDEPLFKPFEQHSLLICAECFLRYHSAQITLAEAWEANHEAG